VTSYSTTLPHRLATWTAGSGLTGLVATLAGAQVLASAFNLLRSKSVALYLGPVGMGTISLVDQLVCVVALVASLGLPYAGLTYLARAQRRGQATFARTYRLLLMLLLAASASVALGASLLTLAWPQVWGQALGASSASVVLALLSVPAIAVHGLQVNLLAVLGHPRLAGLGRLGSTALMSVGSIVGLLAAGLPGLYAGSLVASLCAAGVLVGYAWRRNELRVPGGGPPVSSAWQQQGELLRWCGTAYAISVGQPVAFLLARYAIAQSAGLAELGLFQSAYGVASSVGLLLSQSTAYYLAPVVNRDAPREDKTQRALAFQRLLMLYVVVLAVPLVLFPQLVIAALFSDAFLGAAPYLVVFVVAEALLLLAGVLQTLLLGLGDLRGYLGVSLGGQILLVALVWGVAPTLGLWGVGLAFVAAHGGLLLAGLVRLVTRHRGRLPTSSVVVTLHGLVLLVAAGWLGQALGATGA
jgi:O-antigen/teichoic acid export membrane protein